MDNSEKQRILLAHGGGGQLSEELIRSHILPKLKNKILAKLEDSAKLDLSSGSLCFTTDSYVIKPLFFNGGDIGKLAVCGTVNDLAVAGARPVALSLSMIIEEGFEISEFDRILQSISQTADDCGVEIVTGDTKTVETGSADRIFINTSGIGIRLPSINLGIAQISEDDVIIISGTIGDHGMTILSQRQDIKFQSQLQSDCAALSGLICPLLENVKGIKFMRDPTRGGLAATLNEIAKTSGLSIEICQNDIPVKKIVQAAADMLGFDVLTIANEGKFIVVVSPESAQDCIKFCRKYKLGGNAAIIGRIYKSKAPPTVELVTRIGGRTIVSMPYGRELPRIC